jgi:DegV family protein with EDD domain
MMKKIGIVTDSSSDIPLELAQLYNIEIVPMHIGFDGDFKKDLYEITPEEVYDALDRNIKVHTSAPSVGEFIGAFDKLKTSGQCDVIFCITLSSKLSAAYNSARIASMSYKDADIRLIDSRTSTICLGLIALQAAMAAKCGWDKERIEELICNLIEKNRFIAALESFEYVFKGGRTAFFGKILQKAVRFKSILTIGRNGKVHLTKFVKNSENAIREIYLQSIGYIKKHKLGGTGIKIGIFYGADIKPAKKLEQFFRQCPEIEIEQLIITKITTVISAHTGPGIWGAAISPSAVWEK